MSLLKAQFWVRRESDQPLIAQIRELRLVKVVTCNAGVAEDTGLIPGLGRSPGEYHGNSLPYSCLENPMDRGAWQATVHGVTKGQTWQKRLSTYTLIRTQAKISRTSAPHPTNSVTIALVCLSHIPIRTTSNLTRGIRHHSPLSFPSYNRFLFHTCGAISNLISAWNCHSFVFHCDFNSIQDCSNFSSHLHIFSKNSQLQVLRHNDVKVRAQCTATSHNVYVKWKLFYSHNISSQRWEDQVIRPFWESFLI